MAMTNAERVKLLLNGKHGSASRPSTATHGQLPSAVCARQARSGRYARRQRDRARSRRDHRPAGARCGSHPDRRCTGGRRPGCPAGHCRGGRRARAARAHRQPAGRLRRSTGGRIIGLGNGDPNSHEPEKGSARSLFNGLAQVIVQSLPGSNGKLRLNASVPGLRAAKAEIEITLASPPPSAPSESAQLVLEGWRGIAVLDGASRSSCSTARQRHELLGLARHRPHRISWRGAMATAARALHALR